MAEPKPTRQLTIVDLSLAAVIGALAWLALSSAPVAPSTVERILAVPVCLTLGLAGIAANSLVLGRRVSLQPITKIAYTVAWAASMSRYLVLTSGFGALAPDSIPTIAIAGSGMMLSVSSVIAAIVAAKQSFRIQRPGAGAAVLFFGFYPAVWLFFDALRLTFGAS